jgi:hypothetical protein
MENEQQQEAETLDTTAEETPVTPEETKDWKAEALKYQAIAERKSKQLEKAQAEKPAPVETPPDFVSRAELEDMRFFDKHSELEPYSELIKGLRKQGETLEQAINKDAFKTLFEKAKKADDFDKSRSVLETNPRLGQAVDKLTLAKKAMTDGNVTQAKESAVQAVIDSLAL